MSIDDYQRMLSQMQNTGGLSGQYWISGSQIYGNPLGQSGLGALGAQGFAAQQGLAQQNAGTWQLASLPFPAGTIAQQAAGTNQMKGFSAEPPPKPVKHEGIRAGEIIGYRCWRLMSGWMMALTQDIVWAPGEIMKGDVSKYGVYAFDMMGRAIGEAIIDGGGLVAGSVQMWGEIIEHEFGYRSEFAKIVSLDYIQGADENVLQALRVKYGVDSR